MTLHASDCCDRPRPCPDYEPKDLDSQGILTLASIRGDCEAFYESNGLDLADMDAEQAGHDFYLTRNRHGAGFWDRGLGDVGQRLTDAAQVYGGSGEYVGDDGAIHVSRG